MKNEITTEFRAEQKAEALTRLKHFKVLPNVIKEFKKEDTVYYSESGILFWLSNKPYWMERVRQFENETGNLVYHCIINTYDEIGAVLTLLYVSPNKDEWQMDRDDLPYGQQCCYAMNLDDDTMSEYGAVGLKPLFGGIERTW